MNLRSIYDLIRDAFRQFQRDHGSRLAASLSFYAAISITPLVATLLGLLSTTLGRDAAHRQLLDLATQLMGPQVAQFIGQIAASSEAQLATPSNLISLFKALLVLWGSANVFLELQDSLNLIWNAEPAKGKFLARLFGKRLFGFGLVIAFGFVILVSLIFSAGISTLLTRVAWLSTSVGWILSLTNLVFTLLGSALLFGLLYKTVPDVKISWRVAWLGGSVTGMLFTLGTVALKALLGGQGSPYGVSGSVIVFLLWVYYSAQIVFFGAELTQVYAESRGETSEPFRRRGGRDIAVTDRAESA